MRRSALLTVPVALGALITGYLWGYGVGERDGRDSDSGPEPSHMFEMGYQTARAEMRAYVAGANGG